MLDLVCVQCVVFAGIIGRPMEGDSAPRRSNQKMFQTTFINIGVLLIVSDVCVTHTATTCDCSPNEHIQYLLVNI